MDKLIKKKNESTRKLGSLSQKKSRILHPQDKKQALKTQKNIKLLIVEDNHLVRLSLEAMLSALGYTADFAEDGKTALSAYSSDYQLILMDVDIPYLSGIEVTQIIRAIEKNHRLKNVPIVAMTSHLDEPEYQDQCLSAGMNDICGKPTADQLKALISEYATQ